ncbi:sphingomyelin phosphodiesterase, putative [Pediculus humanus corporis]|uniref:Sphingomyelin phosphodiesterase, putative n=1 Tax=Pediculus humanus subsp. corporis TaxID=121224 RepID=E0W446_PEDHC|nr:sphingomyelin phosphodiesterase, putative [Pediculus humanus corporis]EEB20402.1 sphingomyelin phosphodiesterase, putative [Pediculus humanus corporis]
MIVRGLVIFSFFINFHASGLPTTGKSTECVNEPLWTVVGNHYVKRDDGKTSSCDTFKKDFLEERIFREEYYDILAGIKTNLDFFEINKILDQMVKILKSFQYSLTDELMCTGCSAAVNTYRMLSGKAMKPDDILSLFNKICVDLNIMTPKVCNGTLESYGRTLTTIVDKTNKTSNHVCQFLLNYKCGNENFPESQWNVTLPPTKKPPLMKPSPVPDSVKKLKVLHLTDTHWDTKYEEGTWAECRLPLCCRKENVLPDGKATKAGKYGGWKCDIPEETFDDMLRHVVKQHPDLDYVLWTGDIPPHDIWDQGKDDNVQMLKKTVAKLKSAFPKTPIYPALGNHESVPPNMFPVPDKNALENPMDWLYKELSIEWEAWLPENSTETVRKGAFYTALVRPGLRLVSMNMNYCYSFNWWLLLNNVDPLNELHWLATLLQESENKKESVHIIGHVPPGNKDCLKMWQTNYYKIISRYEDTVTGQFFGHTHYDKFELYYDVADSKRPVGVGYVAPSLTTYTYLNPTYRIYHIEGDAKGSRRFVVDHETWYMDLEKSNQMKKSDWKLLYSAKKDFKMANLYPADWNKVYNDMKTSNETLQLFHKFYWNDSPKRPACGNECKLEMLCEVRSIVLFLFFFSPAHKKILLLKQFIKTYDKIKN